MAGKRWDGTNQVDIKDYKRWDGSSWVACTGKRWTGTAWETFTFKLANPDVAMIEKGITIKYYYLVINLNGNPAETQVKISRTKDGVTTVLQNWTTYNASWGTADGGFNTNDRAPSAVSYTYTVEFQHMGQTTSTTVFAGPNVG